MFRKIMGMLLGAAAVQNNSNMQTLEKHEPPGIVHEEIAKATHKKEVEVERKSTEPPYANEKMFAEQYKKQQGLNECNHCPVHCDKKNSSSIQRLTKEIKKLSEKAKKSAKTTSKKMQSHLDKAKVQLKGFFDKAKEQIEKRRMPKE